MKSRPISHALAFTVALSAVGPTPARSATDTVPVTAENFTRAESDLYFGNIVKTGGFGKYDHRREPSSAAAHRHSAGRQSNAPLINGRA